MNHTRSLAERHTNSVDIRPLLDKEFHHLYVPVPRRHMQGSSIVFACI
jgi:hypothetical protein